MANWLTGLSLHMFTIKREILKHLHRDSVESSQRPVETRVPQTAFKVRDEPGVSASMIRMFMWPLLCLRGSSSELTLACSKLDRHLCEGCSRRAFVSSLRSSQLKQTANLYTVNRRENSDTIRSTCQGNVNVSSRYVILSVSQQQTRDVAASASQMQRWLNTVHCCAS